MRRPRSTLSDVTKSNSNMIGAPASVKTIVYYIELVYDFCLDYSQTMNMREMLEQLINYSDEKKKQFDIIAAMGMAELADEELASKRAVEKDPVDKRFTDFG